MANFLDIQGQISQSSFSLQESYTGKFVFRHASMKPLIISGTFNIDPSSGISFGDDDDREKFEIEYSNENTIKGKMTYKNGNVIDGYFDKSLTKIENINPEFYQDRFLYDGSWNNCQREGLATCYITEQCDEQWYIWKYGQVNFMNDEIEEEQTVTACIYKWTNTELPFRSACVEKNILKKFIGKIKKYGNYFKFNDDDCIVYIYESEQIYKGCVKDNISNGKGTIWTGMRNIKSILPWDVENIEIGKGHNNAYEKYEGDWKDNERHGKGKMEFKSGEWYDGKWKNGKKHGRGKQYRGDGVLFRDGWWKKGIFDPKRKIKRKKSNNQNEACSSSTKKQKTNNQNEACSSSSSTIRQKSNNQDGASSSLKKIKINIIISLSNTFHEQVKNNPQHPEIILFKQELEKLNNITIELDDSFIDTKNFKDLKNKLVSTKGEFIGSKLARISMRYKEFLSSEKKHKNNYLVAIRKEIKPPFTLMSCPVADSAFIKEFKNLIWENSNIGEISLKI